MAQALFSQWIKTLFTSQSTTGLENLDLGKYTGFHPFLPRFACSSVCSSFFLKEEENFYNILNTHGGTHSHLHPFKLFSRTVSNTDVRNQASVEIPVASMFSKEHLELLK